MITQYVLQFFHGLAVSLFSWMQGALPSPPTFLVDMNNALAALLGHVGGPIRAFLPIGPAITAGITMFGIVVITGGIRLARRVLSLFTGGGGNG